MELSVREAAALLARSPRTIRAQLAAGQLSGKRSGRRWVVDGRRLPLSRAQHIALQERADTVRDAVEAALPARATADRRRRRSVTDLKPFQAGRVALRALQSPCDVRAPSMHRAEHALRDGLASLCDASQTFDRDGKIRRLRAARGAFSHALAELLVRDPDDERSRAGIDTIEQEVMPTLAGLLRWADRLPSRAAARDPRR